MSFVNTKIKCKSCGNENNVAFMLPNTPPSFFPNKSEYVIGGCEKEFNNFYIQFICNNCGKRVEEHYTKNEFDALNYEIMD